MRLTVMTDYALRLLMYVGQRPGRLCTIAEVARAYEISETHLMKVTHQLGRAGFLQTLRGKGGGMRLAARPAQIGLAAAKAAYCFAGAAALIATPHKRNRQMLRGIMHVGAISGLLGVREIRLYGDEPAGGRPHAA